MTVSLGFAPHDARTASRSTLADCAVHQSLSTTYGVSVTRSRGRPRERIRFRVPEEGTITWSANRKSSGHAMPFPSPFHGRSWRETSEGGAGPNKQEEPR